MDKESMEAINFYIIINYLNNLSINVILFMIICRFLINLGYIS